MVASVPDEQDFSYTVNSVKNLVYSSLNYKQCKVTLRYYLSNTSNIFLLIWNGIIEMKIFFLSVL